MAQRKFRLNKLRELHATLGALIAESDASYSGALEPDDEPAAQDNPPPFAGQPKAMDSAPSLSKPKGLTARRDSAAARSLNSIPGFDRLAAPAPLPRQSDVFKCGE